MRSHWQMCSLPCFGMDTSGSTFVPMYPHHPCPSRTSCQSLVRRESTQTELLGRFRSVESLPFAIQVDSDEWDHDLPLAPVSVVPDTPPVTSTSSDLTPPLVSGSSVTNQRASSSRDSPPVLSKPAVSSPSPSSHSLTPPLNLNEYV